MTVPLYIIIDVSGSMNEMGKIHLQRNLCRYVTQITSFNQETYTDFDVQFYQWEQTVSKIVIRSDGDIPALEAKRASSLSALSDFLSQSLNGTKTMRTLILSDGYFHNSNILSFQEHLSAFPDLIIRTVAVGADADLLKLKKISSNNSVYLSENISSAINSTAFGSDEPLTAPVSTAQILQSEPVETEEPEEDWDA